MMRRNKAGSLGPLLPRGASIYFVLGFAITACSLALAFISGAAVSNAHPSSCELSDICQEQLNVRTCRLQIIEEAEDIARTRRDTARDQVSDVNAHAARETFEREAKWLRALSAQKKGLEVKAASWRDMLSYSTIFLLGFVLSLYLARTTLAAERAWFVELRSQIQTWHKPFVLILVLLVVLTLLSQTYSSLLNIDKHDFGWDSWCINFGGWFWIRVAFVGAHIGVAYPIAIIWVALSPKCRPTITLGDVRRAKEGLEIPIPLPSGARAYAKFWGRLLTVGLFAFGIILVVRLMRISSVAEVDLIYLAAMAGYSAFPAVLVARVVNRLNEVRQEFKKCHEQQRFKGLTEDDLLEDPTKGIIGDTRWKLPASVTIVATVSWLVLGQLGATDSLIGASGKSEINKNVADFLQLDECMKQSEKSGTVAPTPTPWMPVSCETKSTAPMPTTAGGKVKKERAADLPLRPRKTD